MAPIKYFEFIEKYKKRMRRTIDKIDIPPVNYGLRVAPKASPVLFFGQTGDEKFLKKKIETKKVTHISNAI